MAFKIIWCIYMKTLSVTLGAGGTLEGLEFKFWLQEVQVPSQALHVWSNNLHPLFTTHKECGPNVLCIFPESCESLCICVCGFWLCGWDFARSSYNAIGIFNVQVTQSYIWCLIFRLWLIYLCIWIQLALAARYETLPSKNQLPIIKVHVKVFGKWTWTLKQ